MNLHPKKFMHSLLNRVLPWFVLSRMHELLHESVLLLPGSDEPIILLIIFASKNFLDKLTLKET